MKKLSALLLSSLVLALPACDSGDDDSDTNATTDTDGTASASASASATDTDGDSASASASASASDSDSDTSSDETGDTTGADETGDTADTSDPTGGGEAQCQYRCNGDEDCAVDGTSVGTCVDNRFCLNTCESDTDCVAQLSGWEFQPCDNNKACPAGPCVDLGDGAGGCAVEPTEFLDCAASMLEEVEVTDIEGSTVTVCGNTSGSCEDSGLGADICMLEGEVTTCADTGCPDGFTCGKDGACRCDNDDSCLEGQVCADSGACINPCSDASDCTDDLPYDGGEYVCE